MRPITKEEYEKLNQSLAHLASLFKNIGIAEFSITNDSRTLKWDNATHMVQPDIMHRFCDNIDVLYQNEKDRLA